MRKGILGGWGRLGRAGQSFILLTVAFLLLHFLNAGLAIQIAAGLLMTFFGSVTAYQIARRLARRAIWRLRNRLIVAYVFIAVVPIVLILALVVFAGKGIIGQVAVYLVDTELSRREARLQSEVTGLANVPPDNPEGYLQRFLVSRPPIPNTELVMRGSTDLRYPRNSKLEVPEAWQSGGEQHYSGLIVREDNGKPNLYVWAYAAHAGNRAVAIAPVTHELLAGLVPQLGDVNYTPVMGHIQKSHVPPAVNVFDFPVTGWVYPVTVRTWESPEDFYDLYLTVDTRLSGVLGILFGSQKNTGFNRKYSWADIALYLFLLVSVLFLLLELISLVAGVQLSRSITGAVHELYEGTQHVKKYDFSYRIPVRGNDQLSELANSFNSMTDNLGRLIVVAKEKERLESELSIAREVQDQLFPKDVPFTKTLELKGVCHPARMVSGDYYDFMALPHDSLAFAIGDVAGKGISAALLMATIQSTMRTQINTATAANGNYKAPSTAFLVSNLNRQLYANTAPEKYATFYFAMYDEVLHSLTYTNAGHLSPLLVRDGLVSLLEPTGTVVGAFPFAVYEEKTVKLEHGDMLVAYTDGLVEPENAYGEMYGEERLTELLLKYTRADSSEIIARAMEAVVQWTGSSELQDDMTMVVARRI